MSFSPAVQRRTVSSCFKYRLHSVAFRQGLGSSLRKCTLFIHIFPCLVYSHATGSRGSQCARRDANQSIYSHARVSQSFLHCRSYEITHFPHTNYFLLTLFTILLSPILFMCSFNIILAYSTTTTTTTLVHSLLSKHQSAILSSLLLSVSLIPLIALRLSICLTLILDFFLSPSIP